MSLSAQIISVIIGPLLAVYVIRQLREIHKLVNSRLSEALDEIKRLGGREEEF